MRSKAALFWISASIFLVAMPAGAATWAESPAPFSLQATCNTMTAKAQLSDVGGSASADLRIVPTTPGGSPGTCTLSWSCSPTNWRADKGSFVKQSGQRADAPTSSWADVEGIYSGVSTVTLPAGEQTHTFTLSSCLPPSIESAGTDLSTRIIVLPFITAEPNPILPGEKTTLTWFFQGKKVSEGDFFSFARKTTKTSCDVESETTKLNLFRMTVPSFSVSSRNASGGLVQGSAQVGPLLTEETYKIHCQIKERFSTFFGIVGTSKTLYDESNEMTVRLGEASTTVATEPEATSLSIMANGKEEVQITRGQTAAISWEVKGIVPGSCRVAGSAGNTVWTADNATETTPSLTSNATYVLTCKDLQNMNVSKTARVFVVGEGSALSVTCNLLSEPPFFIGDEIRWRARVTGGSPANTSEIRYTWSGTGGLTGSQGTASLNAANAGEYSASVTARKGTESASAKCSDTAKVYSNVIPTVSLESDVSSAQLGDTATLTFTTTNVEKCTVTSDSSSWNKVYTPPKATEHVTSEPIERSTIFTATCSVGPTVVSDSVRVLVAGSLTPL